MQRNISKIDVDGQHPTDKNRDKELGQKEENANTLLMHCLESFINHLLAVWKPGWDLAGNYAKQKNQKQNHILYMNINI